MPDFVVKSHAAKVGSATHGKEIVKGCGLDEFPGR
jgi:hypothetical protein